MKTFKRLIIAMLLGTLSGCSSMLFFPTPYLYTDPAKMGFKFEEVRFPSYDGTMLYGWYFHHKKPAGRPKALIFFAHGNGQNVSAQFLNLIFVLDEGYDFFIFDYRGYGSSQGASPTPPEAVGDTIAALKWTDARAKKDGLPMIAFAQSLGTALMLEALVETKATIHPKLIALDSPFLSYQWAAASVLSKHWFLTAFQPFAFLFVSDQSAPRLRIKELAPTPIFVIHGENDQIIDIKLGRETYDTALEPKEFVAVPGAGHIQSFWCTDCAKYRQLFLSRMDASL